MSLIELTVENLAVIERIRLPISPGFTVLTGETGAGKSLIVDALALALGARVLDDEPVVGVGLLQARGGGGVRCDGGHQALPNIFSRVCCSMKYVPGTITSAVTPTTA